MEEEKVDTFNAPYYAPSAEELNLQIQKQGSFIMDRHEAFEINWDGDADQEHDQTVASSGKRVAKTIRAVVESMIEAHFGKEIMDDLFRRYAELVSSHLSKSRTKYINLVISLVTTA